jgi:hypothetical protein
MSLVAASGCRDENRRLRPKEGSGFSGQLLARRGELSARSRRRDRLVWLARRGGVRARPVFRSQRRRGGGLRGRGLRECPAILGAWRRGEKPKPTSPGGSPPRSKSSLFARASASGPERSRSRAEGAHRIEVMRAREGAGVRRREKTRGREEASRGRRGMGQVVDGRIGAVRCIYRGQCRVRGPR